MILVKIWHWLKLLNSVPFMKKKLLNQVNIRIWSCFSQFCSEWRQTSKLVNFQEFRSGPSIRFISKFENDIKLLNSVPFIEKALVNQVCIRILSSWLTFTVSQGMKGNIEISQFSRFLLRSEYAIHIKIWKWVKLLNSVPFIKKPLVNQV